LPCPPAFLPHGPSCSFRSSSLISLFSSLSPLSLLPSPLSSGGEAGAGGGAAQEGERRRQRALQAQRRASGRDQGARRAAGRQGGSCHAAGGGGAGGGKRGGRGERESVFLWKGGCEGGPRPGRRLSSSFSLPLSCFPSLLANSLSFCPQKLSQRQPGTTKQLIEVQRRCDSLQAQVQQLQLQLTQVGHTRNT
jgi:hypothetical protein